MSHPLSTPGRPRNGSLAPDAAPLLQVERLETAYGASQVLFGIDLRVDAGEVVGLLGRNGMGKTTLIRSICGLVTARSGSIAFGGKPIVDLHADRVARLGIGLVPEGRQVFPNLTVAEHLTAFAANRNGSAGPWTAEKVYRLFPRLAERSDNMGNQLSGGEQQMLAIGRALVTNPRLLILDEATEGLAPLIREEIWRCLDQLRRAGQTILIVDKYVNRLIDLADRHVIIERGRLAWAGTSPELASDRSLWSRYLGA
jgi:branched-chain amino acid transport system ATP-binding protein